MLCVYESACVYDLCVRVRARARAPTRVHVTASVNMRVRVWVSLGTVGHRVKIFGLFQLYLIIILPNSEITPIDMLVFDYIANSINSLSD